MITAATLDQLRLLSAHRLSQLIQSAGHKQDTFTGANFLGMSNGNQFCYRASYLEDGNTSSVKVFVTLDTVDGSLSAEY